MTALGRSSVSKLTTFHQFGRHVKREPCAQCLIRMVFVRGEPEFREDDVMRVTYRCPDCGLLESHL